MPVAWKEITLALGIKENILVSDDRWAKFTQPSRTRALAAFLASVIGTYANRNLSSFPTFILHGLTLQVEIKPKIVKLVDTVSVNPP